MEYIIKLYLDDILLIGVPTKATVEIIAEGDDEKDVIASIAKVIKEQKVAE